MKTIKGICGKDEDRCVWHDTVIRLTTQRRVLFAALCNTFKDISWKSCKWFDNTFIFGGNSFVVGIDTPNGAYVFTFENCYWDMFKIPQLEMAKEYDDCIMENDIDRLLSLAVLADVSEEKCERSSWAETEVELGKKREREINETPDSSPDYGELCYDSALKAFNCLLGEGHSGMSVTYTKYILNRLIDGKPLTPILERDYIWNDVSDMGLDEDQLAIYQCKRMSSLFKYVYKNGRVKYSDNNQYEILDVETKDSYHSGLVSRVLGEEYPLFLPYYPSEPTKVYCRECLTDRKNGDYDTVCISYAVKPEGTKVAINRYFKEEDHKWVEINASEYLCRLEADEHRAEKEILERCDIK